MEQITMDVDELSSKDSDPAKLSNKVEDVQMLGKCNFDRKFEVLESADLETECSRLPQVLDQNRQDFHRKMNTGETFIQDNCLSANEPNQNYFYDKKGMFESIGAVRFETAFMQNSLSRLSCEDDDFRIDLHPSRGSQSNFKYSGANVSQTITTTDREAINMPVKGKGHINSITNETSSSDEVISESERTETNDDHVIQLMNSGVIDTNHQEESCQGEIGCGHLTEREVPSNAQTCERHVGVECGFKASLEATAYQMERKLSSDVKIECQDQKQLTTETANKTVSDAAALDCRSVNRNSDNEENVKTLMAVFDQSYSGHGEMIQIGCEINRKTEASNFFVSAVESAIDHEIAGESLIATDFVSAVESAINHEIAGESLIATDFVSAVESAINHEIAGESLIATDFVSAVESAINHEIAGESLIATDFVSAVESAINHEIAGESLNTTDFESAVESAIDCEIAGESIITTDFESVVKSAIDDEIADESLIATDCEHAVESAIDHEIAGESLIATDFVSAVESAIDHEIADESLNATDCECAVESKSAIESNSAAESKSFCESDGEALNNLDLSQIHRCDTSVISDTCNDLIGHQSVYENEIMVEFCNQAEEISKNTVLGKDETKTDSKHDTGNDVQMEVKAENMNEDRNEIQYEINEDFENDLNATAENAVKDDLNWSNNTEFYYKVKHAFEDEQINEMEHDVHDNWKATIFAMPFPVLIENTEVPRYQIKQDIKLKIKDESTDGSTNEKTDENIENTKIAVMDDILTGEDQSVIKVECHPRSELDDKFDDEVVKQNVEKFDIADANRMETYSSEYVNMNENKANDRNEQGSTVETEIDGYDHNENKINEELSKNMKTEHESHLKTEACRELEVETRNKSAIQVQDEVEDKLEITQLPASGHQTGIDKIHIQHDEENKMGERLSIEEESTTEKLVENDDEDSSQKIMSGNLCEIAKDMIDRKYGSVGEESVSINGEGKQIDEDEAICQFENGLSVENVDVVEDILGVNNYLDLGSENKCIRQGKDGFRQHAMAEIQNEIVAKGEILNEVFQNGNTDSEVGDTAEFIAVHGLTDVSLSEGLLVNHPTSNISSAETEFNFTPCVGQSQSRIHNDRSGFATSVEYCCSEIGASITTSTGHQLAVSQAFFEGNEKHLECSYQFRTPTFTGKTKIPDDFLQGSLTQHNVKDVLHDQQSNSTEVQDCYQNPKNVQKEASKLDFLLSSTVEKSYSDSSNSFNFQAKIIDCEDTTANVDFEKPTSVSDQFMTFNDENNGLIKAFGHCEDEITTFNYLDYGVRSNAVNLTTESDCSVPDVEANEEDSNSCNAFGDILNQNDSSGLQKLSNQPQQHSTTGSGDECISHFTANQEESSCSVQNTCSSENFVFSDASNSLLLYSSTVYSTYVNRAKPEKATWPDVYLKTESCFSKVSQNPTVAVDETLNCEELLPVKNQGRVQQQPDSQEHLQHELQKVENLDVFAVPQLRTESCAAYEGNSMRGREFNAFGEASDVRVADMSITQSDLSTRCMIRDQLKKRPQEVPSCDFTEDDLQMSTEETSTTGTCVSPRDFSIVDPAPAKEMSPCSECAFEMPSDEQQVPSVESNMKHGNQMRGVSCLPIHLEETLYEEPPAKRRCCDVGVGGNFDHDIDHKWCKDKHETDLGGYSLPNLTGVGKERVPLYAWKNFAEPAFEDHSGITEQYYPVSRDTAAVPLVMPQLSKCQKPLRLGLSRRYRAPTRLHPNYKTPTD